MRSEIDFNDFKKDPHKRIDEIEQEISFLKTVITALIKALEKQTPKQIINPQKHHKTLSSAFDELINLNFFSTPKSLGDVKIYLSDKCTRDYGRSAISHILFALFKQGKLDRLGTERKYQYINNTDGVFKDLDYDLEEL
jgi:hypothetical protein